MLGKHGHFRIPQIRQYIPLYICVGRASVHLHNLSINRVRMLFRTAREPPEDFCPRRNPVVGLQRAEKLRKIGTQRKNRHIPDSSTVPDARKLSFQCQSAVFREPRVVSDISFRRCARNDVDAVNETQAPVENPLDLPEARAIAEISRVNVKVVPAVVNLYRNAVRTFAYAVCRLNFRPHRRWHDRTRPCRQ